MTRKRGRMPKYVNMRPEQVEEIHMCPERVEEIHAGLRGDFFEEWRKKDSWTVYEAIELLTTKVSPPTREAEDRRTPLDDHRFGHPEAERLRREMVRAIKNPKGCPFVNPEKGEGWVSPREFVQWALSKGFPVHERLRKALAVAEFEGPAKREKTKTGEHEARQRWTGKKPKDWGDIVLNLHNDSRTLDVAICAASAPEERPKAKDIQPCTYADLGFADKRTKKPVKAWDLLIALAEGHGILTDPRENDCRSQEEIQEACKESDRRHKQVFELNRRFQEFFDLPGKPLRHSNEDSPSRCGEKIRSRYWKSRFVIGRV